MPNSVMNEQIVELQIKCSYLEDVLDKLDLVVIEQQAKIDLLIKEVKYLKQQETSNDKQEVNQARNELPPHY